MNVYYYPYCYNNWGYYPNVSVYDYYMPILMFCSRTRIPITMPITSTGAAASEDHSHTRSQIHSLLYTHPYKSIKFSPLAQSKTTCRAIVEDTHQRSFIHIDFYHQHKHLFDYSPSFKSKCRRTRQTRIPPRGRMRTSRSRASRLYACSALRSCPRLRLPSRISPAATTATSARFVLLSVWSANFVFDDADGV